MNKTALEAAFTSTRFSISIYQAMVNTARNKFTVAHVTNRKGHACIAVRYNHKEGFTYRSRSGKLIDKNLINSFLRQQG